LNAPWAVVVDRFWWSSFEIGDGGVADSVIALPGGCVDVLLFCCCCDLGAGEDLGIQC